MLKDILKDLRKNKKLSQNELSKLLNIPQTTYSQYETGKAEPNIDMLIKLANFYNTSIDFLVGRCGNKKD